MTRERTRTEFPPIGSLPGDEALFGRITRTNFGSEKLPMPNAATRGVVNEPTHAKQSQKKPTRLTGTEKDEIRRRWRAGEEERDLAIAFGVHPATISRVMMGRRVR